MAGLVASCVATWGAAAYDSAMTEQMPQGSIVRIARENGNQESPEPLDLPSRVRELRKSRGLTLEQAAGQAGLAALHPVKDRKRADVTDL